MIPRRDSPFAQVVVPDHTVLDRGTLRAIIRQAGLSVDEFVKLLGWVGRYARSRLASRRLVQVADSRFVDHAPEERFLLSRIDVAQDPVTAWIAHRSTPV